MTKFTIAEAARAEGIKLFDLIRAVKQGKLETELQSGIIYISQDSLDLYLGKGAAVPVEEVPPIAVAPEPAPALPEPRVTPVYVPALPEAPATPVHAPVLAETPPAPALAPSLDQLVESPITTEELPSTLKLPVVRPSLKPSKPEAEQPPAAPATKTILDRMSNVYGLQLPYLLRMHEESKLRTLLVNVGGCMGDAWLKTMFREGHGTDLLGLGTEGIRAYSRKVVEVTTLIKHHFPEEIPACYDSSRAPNNFLPGEIRRTYGNLITEIDENLRAEIEENKEQERRTITAREMPTFREIAELILGERYETLTQEFPEEKVALVAAMLYDAVGEQDTKTLLDRDTYKQVLNMGPTGLENYTQNLRKARDMLAARYPDEVPEEFDLERSPMRFIPERISSIIKKLERLGDRAGSKDNLYTIEEICTRTTLPRDLVQGLIGEGHDVYVLEAMLKEGFDLQGPSPIMGARKVTRQHWERNASTAYSSLGVPEDYTKWRNAERLFRRIDLIQQASDSRKGCFCMNSSWARVTEELPFLKEYLAHYLAPKGRKEEE